MRSDPGVLNLSPVVSPTLYAIFVGFFFSASLLHAQPEDEAPQPPPESVPQLSIADAFTLGLVEGITEYLPISSTGHLILTNRLLGLDREVQIVGRNGQPLWKTPPTPNRPGIPYTFRDAVNDYIIVIQAGAIAAVVLLYWRRLLSILMGMLGRNRDGLLLGRNLILSFLPAVFFGLLLESWIEARLFGPLPVVFALAAGGVLMLLVEARRKHASRDPEGGPDLHQLSPRQSLVIGLLQCVALWPGTSRSMMTIVGGYVVGLSPARAAEYSFLLGLITLSAAAGYKALKGGDLMLQVLGPLPVALGCIVACISAALAVRWLVHYLTRHGLALFAYYRFALAVAVLLGLVIFS